MKGKIMNEWQKYNDEVKQAIEEPSKKDLIQMDDLHLVIYELNQEKVSLSESLSKVNDKLEKYYEQVSELLNSKTPPNWAWTWMFKKTNIQWKKHFIKRLGEAEANKILSVAKQKEYPKIGIQYCDPNPSDIPETPIEKAKKDKPKRLDLPKPKINPLFDRLEKMKGN